MVDIPEVKTIACHGANPKAMISLNMDLIIKSDLEHPSRMEESCLLPFTVAWKVAIFPKSDKIHFLLLFPVAPQQRCRQSRLLWQELWHQK